MKNHPVILLHPTAMKELIHKCANIDCKFGGFLDSSSIRILTKYEKLGRKHQQSRYRFCKKCRISAKALRIKCKDCGVIINTFNRTKSTCTRCRILNSQHRSKILRTVLEIPKEKELSKYAQAYLDITNGLEISGSNYGMTSNTFRQYILRLRKDTELKIKRKTVYYIEK